MKRFLSAFMIVMAVMSVAVASASAKGKGGGGGTAPAVVTTNAPTYVTGDTAVISWTGGAASSQLEVLCKRTATGADRYGSGQIKATNGQSGQFFLPIMSGWANDGLTPIDLTCTATLYSYPQHVALGPAATFFVNHGV